MNPTVDWTTLHIGDLVEVKAHHGVPSGIHKVSELDDPDDADGIPVQVTWGSGEDAYAWISPRFIVRKVELGPDGPAVTKARVVVALADFGVVVDDIEGLAAKLIEVLR